METSHAAAKRAISVIVENNSILNPKWEPPHAIMWVLDTATWLLPVAAAILSVGAGMDALHHDDHDAALLGIGGGVVSALGVLVTGYTSRVRDNRMERIATVGDLSLNIAADTQSRLPGNF
jgi:hypothetical protein